MENQNLKKVLIIEDQASLSEIYKIRLQAAGCQVEQAFDGQTGLQRAKELRPDLILLDMMLPVMSGFDLLNNLRADPQLKQTEVVVLSALGEKVDIQNGQKLGVNHWLVKSHATLEKVIATITEAVRPQSTQLAK